MAFLPVPDPQTRQARIDMVHAWQRHYRMEPRSDSKLTQLFAEGALGTMPADEVARELLATDYIYKHTLYGELQEDVLRLIAARLRKMHKGLSWPSTWTFVRFYGPIALKLMCLSASGERIPNEMPSDMPNETDAMMEVTT